MSTLADMVSRIADDINRTDLSTTQIPLAINRAIKYYKKEPFWFKETTDTFVTVANQKIYTSTDTGITDISRIHTVEIEANSANEELLLRDVKWIEYQNPNDSTGVPTDYAWWQNSFYLYLVPNGVYTIRVYYTKDYPELTGVQTNDWITYAEDLIEARARWWLYTRIILDTEQALVAKNEENDALFALREINEGYVAQGRIPPTSF